MSKTATTIFVIISVLLAGTVVFILWYQKKKALQQSVDKNSGLTMPQQLGLVQPPVNTIKQSMQSNNVSNQQAFIPHS